jgi:hypothetical protein
MKWLNQQSVLAESYLMQKTVRFAPDADALTVNCLEDTQI